EGGRMWTMRDGKPWYFLEEMYPAYGNLVPRDIASRAVFKVVFEMGLGVDGENAVYLDVTHKDPAELTRKLGGVLEIYEKFMGADPRVVPMKVFPAMHYSMGGLWVDYDHMTNLPGLFAVGEVDYQYHGANRLGANSLLSCLYGGMVCGPKMLAYAKGLKRSAADAASGFVERERKRQADGYERVYTMNGGENAYAIWRELGEWMTQHVTVERYNKNLQRTDDKILELKDRWGRIGVNDRNRWLNQEVSFVRQLWNMLELGRVITLGALARDESRGAHYKPDFPQRDDARFLKTTKARWTSDGPELSYEDVDVSMIKPRVRKYDTEKTVSA
ncbi:MAG TPA: FAD-binding protein, partial [Candidatus Binatia bacterium]